MRLAHAPRSVRPKLNGEMGKMDLKQLRQRCMLRLNELPLPVPFDIMSFCDALRSHQARPILLHPITSRAGICGLWIATPDADHIFYERDTSPLHQEHIILHELSHLLCGHRSAPMPQTDWSRLLLPDLDAKMVQTVLQRAAYSAEEEREAELLATFILQRAERRILPRTPAMEPDVALLLGRLETALDESGEGKHG